MASKNQANRGQFTKNDPRRAPGRPKGCPNKFTSLKESVLEVYQRMGGTQALFDWASKSDRNRHDFFAWMLSMLPKDQVLKIEEMIPKKVVIREYSDKPDEPAK
jgi:hypothetical protein